ncbi:hypothetical protein A7Q10_02045 [Methylacidiphilum caldifontis]|uniref:SAM-dependent methyltransferase n=2 Tax=Methylacidiphilum caldifontis TaxID=2795386 RepID=A0A4Y8P7Y0_9BACT|nr:hypothetical protein A7Q10_02045 [Methylacidiphilum caldifontis]
MKQDKKSYRELFYSTYLTGKGLNSESLSLVSSRSRQMYFQKVIRLLFPDDRNARILDIGCGYGLLLHSAQLEGYRFVEGVDVSVEQVEAATNLGIQNVKVGNLIEELESRPSSSLDLVVAFDVLEHFTREETLEICDQVYRVLRKGGKWIVHVPNGESPFYGRIRYGDLTHETAYTQSSLHHLLRCVGFEKVDIREDILPIHGFRSAVRWVLWCAIRSIWRFYLLVETGSGKGLFTQNLLAVAIKGGI